MKKSIAIILALVLVLSFAACGKKADAKKTIKVGASITPHAEILREAAKLLEKQGIVKSKNCLPSPYILKPF